jgi:hypothetical protein
MEVIPRKFWNEEIIWSKCFWEKYRTDKRQEVKFQYRLHASHFQEKSKQFFTLVRKIEKYFEIMKCTSTYT